MRSSLLFALALVSSFVYSQTTIDFTLRITDPSSQIYHVAMVASGFKEEVLEFKMSVWTPGYYQIMNYAKYVSAFKATDNAGKPLKWELVNKNTWKVTKGKSKTVKITYDSKAAVAFVANSLLDAEHGYIMPAGVFMHPKNHISHPLTLTIQNDPQWSTIATGLEPVNHSKNVFTAPDFDTFYDSPILLGNLEELPSFSIQNIPHYFIGYHLGEFDKKQFISDLEKIVTSATQVIGDIPYTHYTFLAAGPVPGGIEHLNSTGFGFSSKELNSRAGLVRMYNFLSHEYFHHYNVKRIRPVELGPFNYDKGSPTTLLWISEGFTNYYDELLVKRAGIIPQEEYLKEIENRINSYENKPGKLFQTASDASYNTWADGPFGRTGDDAFQTISVYEKGSLLGLILDLQIRHLTQNQKSLDDVMRTLYTEYYQQKKRGFTENEFREVAERMAGQPLPEFFEHVNTTKDIDFKKYLSYAGLETKMEPRERPEPYFGLSVRQKSDTVVISKVEWRSPAWDKSLHSKDIITSINGEKATLELFNQVIQKNEPIQITFSRNGIKKEVTLRSGIKTERIYTIEPHYSATESQKALLNDWLKNH
ncbi:MAG: peptidase M61 [Azospira oryzae]|jgi:predicted metalloprotease with PDZ domain|nr:MAG: peptidase M61 [Azospira oryzae]